MTESPIALSALLPGRFDPVDTKLHCAVYNGNEYPSDVLANDWDEWVGWNQWRETNDDFNRQFIFSLAQRRDDKNLWIFGGIFEVVGRLDKPKARSYDIVQRDDLMGEYVRRLVLKFVSAPRNPRLNMENFVDKFTVHSILEHPYAGEPFPGLDEIDHSLGALAVVVKQKREDWRAPLQTLKGVYVIHDIKTGQKYVGAAYGENGTGIWERMSQYARTLHGDHSVQLNAHVDKMGDEYARENLRFSLLEHWSRIPEQYVIDRESYWRRVLLADTKHGFNGKPKSDLT